MATNTFFAKIGAAEHISMLQDDGVLYLNNLRYFWQLEDGGKRGDPCDGIQEFQRGPFARAFKNGTELPVRIENWTFRIHPDEPERINIFCLSAFRQPDGVIDSRLAELGTSTLIITDLHAFMARLQVRLKTEGVGCSADFVEYVPNDYRGEIGPFRKFERFAWQCEWRFVTYGGQGGPRIIKIGSLKDISIVVPTTDLQSIVAGVGYATDPS
jgi:hypothetical protein